VAVAVYSRGAMAVIQSGRVTAFFLFDVAESFDLPAIDRLIGPTTKRQFASKSTAPSYIQYHQPPLTIEGTALDSARGSFRVRFKIFDYGVISVTLMRDLPDAWTDLVARGIEWQEDPQLGQKCELLCRDLLSRIAPATTLPRQHFVGEDYFVFSVSDVEGRPDAARLITDHGDEIARLLRGEREALSSQERDEVLRHRVSYLTSDLVVPTWNAAFVYDTEAGAAATLEILEFANSQLLEFRYFDGILETELARIYSQLRAPGWFAGWNGRRYTRAAQQVHSLFIDVNELTDRTENALKIAGDVYTARLFANAAARLGLDHWKANVRDKLTTLDAIYRFAVERTGMRRGEFLEAAIVAILVFELVLFFLGIMK
jgi:hypothetical protein